MTGARAVLRAVALAVALAGPAAAAPVKKEKPVQKKVQSAKELYAVAIMHLHGAMVQRDEKRALQLMEQAADRGYLPAMYYLGVLYHDGIGGQRNRQKAAFWLGKAAEQCDPQAEYSYGLILLAGDGLEPDPEEGLEFIGRAAGRGYGPAADFLRRLVAYGGPQQQELFGESRRLPDMGVKEDRSRFKEGGLILDQGDFSLKFSLPSLEAAPYPRVTGEERLLDRLQGGKVELVVPLGTGK